MQSLHRQKQISLNLFWIPFFLPHQYLCLWQHDHSHAFGHTTAISLPRLSCQTNGIRAPCTSSRHWHALSLVLSTHSEGIPQVIDE